MKDGQRVRQLQKIAALIRDRDLAALGTASAHKNQTETLLAALDRVAGTAELDPILANQVQDRFGLWTTNRRISLNQQLARDTVTWMAAHSKAQIAYGQHEVLKRMAKQALRTRCEK
jgi:hypothetical protein